MSDAATYADTRPHERALLDAWRGLDPSHRYPAEVHTLKARADTRVYRLSRALVNGAAVIVKEGTPQGIAVERTVYERVLPHLPTSTLALYGGYEREGRSGLFLEDAGDLPYRADFHEHRALAGTWLAGLHLYTPKGSTDTLPHRDAAYYRSVVKEARETLLRARDNSVLTVDDASRLERLVSAGDAVLESWPKLEALWRDFPESIVHGDFWSGNVRVRVQEDALQLLPFDWGMAGWGVPAVDLAGVDLGAYRATLERGGGGLEPRTLTRIAHSGRVLRAFAAIPGEGPTLLSPWPARALKKLHFYEAEIEEALRELET